MTITKGSNGFRHYYPIIRFGLLPFLVLLIILVIGAQPGSGPMRGLGAFGKYSGSGSIWSGGYASLGEGSSRL